MNSEISPNIQVVHLPLDDTRATLPLEKLRPQSDFNDFNSCYLVPTKFNFKEESVDKNVGKLSTMAEGGRLERSDSDDDDWVPRRCYQFSRRRKRNSRKKKRYPHEGRSHEHIYQNKEKHIEKSTCRVKGASKFATKSCDNIFFQTVRCKADNAEGNVFRSRKTVRSEASYIWKTTTRSEEHLPRLAVQPSRACQIPKANRDQRFTWSLPSLLSGGRKNGALVGFLGKLGHKRRHRPPSPSPKGSLGRTFAPTPWILVEFSETSDVQEGDSGNESDHSFEAAIAVLEERKREGRLSTSNKGEVSHMPRVYSEDSSPFDVSLVSSVKSVVHQKVSTNQPMKSESVPRHCLAPDEERNKSSGLRLAVAPRPHTLGIRGKVAIPSTQKDCEGTSGKAPEGAEREGGVAASEMLPSRNVPRMPSLESIGSCSLDADVTASECSERIGITASQRTLHSISFVDFSPLRAAEDSGVLVGPGHSDSTERNIENQPSRSSSPSITATSPRPPSYVSLSCSISGYSPLAAYDSELRKGFRSGRDVIPVPDIGSAVTKHKLSLGDQDNLAHKDTSGFLSLEGSKASICSPVHRKPCVGDVAMNGSLHEQGEADGRGTEPDICSIRSGHQESVVGTVRVVEFTSQNKSYVRTVTRTFDSGSFQSGNIMEERPPSPTYLTPSKSFVQQRVERLYGPGALAQGFFRRSPHRGLCQTGRGEDVTDDASTSPRSCSSLPVLRHLRPEFRKQLPVRETSPKVPPVVTIIPITVEGSESPSKEVELNLNNNTEKKISTKAEVNEVIVSALPDLCPAAPEVVLPVPTEAASDVGNGTDTNLSLPHPDSEVKDGHYFIRLLKGEITRLTKLVESAEKELNDSEDGQVALPEEAAGWLRSAAGQARLLMRQKMQQFEGLCHKHLLQSPGEAFPTTLEDLAGFWDMVLLQVDSVDAMFQEIDRLRASGWVETTAKAITLKDGKQDSNSSKPETGQEGETGKKRLVTKRVVNATTTNVGKPSGAAKARDEARRKMMEERRRAMRERQKGGVAEGNGSIGEVEIFVPENK